MPKGLEFGTELSEGKMRQHVRTSDVAVLEPIALAVASCSPDLSLGGVF